MFRKQLLALCTLLTLVTACSKKDNNETPAVPAEAKAIQEYLSVTTGLTIFATSFKEVSITAADVSSGITVFAPDNGAITNYDPNARVEAIGLTTAEVKDHIVKGIVKKADLTNGKKLTALSGKELLITVDGDNIYINGVLIADVNEDVAKQVVYKISNVLCRKPGAVFGTKAEAQLFLDNLYATVGSWHQLQTVIDGVLSDDADCSVSTFICPLDNFTVTPTNSFTTTLWTGGYSLIASANRLIQNVPALNLPATETNELIAQAKGLRAFVYYQLATYYGALPLLTQMVDDNKLPRSSVADTYTFIKNDLNAAIAVLPARYTGADRRRINADACKLLLARIAMAQGDFTTAKQLTNTLIQSAAYSLVSTANIFASDANAEIVWNMTTTIASAYNTFFADGTGKTFVPAARYAEVLLINSEARVALGELDATYTNQLLTRRSQPTVTFTDNDQARDVVRLAWKNELHHEGQRFAKVVKWGIAMQVVGSKGYHDYNSLMPVPQSILINNPNMTQNVGYQ